MIFFTFFGNSILVSSVSLINLYALLYAFTSTDLGCQGGPWHKNRWRSPSTNSPAAQLQPCRHQAPLSATPQPTGFSVKWPCISLWLLPPGHICHGPSAEPLCPARKISHSLSPSPNPKMTLAFCFLLFISSKTYNLLFILFSKYKILSLYWMRFIKMLTATFASRRQGELKMTMLV